MTLALLAVALLGAGYVVLTFNGLTRLRQMARNAWADIDVQLRRRHDLVPNLVRAVQGHAGYERSTLEAVIDARSRAQGASGPEAAAAAERTLSEGVNRILALAEAYPDLKAGQSFLDLQRSLVEIEDHVQEARRYYNAVVRDLNTRIEQFPSNLIAGLLGFEREEPFGLSDPAEATVPEVRP